MGRIAKGYMEHQRKHWMRHDAWRFLPPKELFEHKYRPDQPRVPAGNPKGGQWTTDTDGQAADGLNAFALEERISIAVATYCELMHRQDLFICRAVQSPACYAQAYLRYSNCLSGRPIPPLNF